MKLRFALPLLACAFLALSGFYSCAEHPALNTPTATTSTTGTLQWVDPMIGTDVIPWSRGNVSPAATAPFGRVKLGPDTGFGGKGMSTSGYGSKDTHMHGFSHTRLSGTGAWEGGLLRVQPLTKELATPYEVRNEKILLAQDTERASPGYYSVYLYRPHVQAEMTATPRTGMHRYTFYDYRDPRAPDLVPHRYLYFQLNSHISDGGAVTEITAELDPGLKRLYVTGLLKDAFSARYGGLRFFFVFESDTAWTSHRFFSNSNTTTATTWVPSETDGDSWLALDFGPEVAPSSQVNLRVGLSYVDRTGAEDVLTQENLSNSFEDILQATRTSWEDLLSRVQVEGAGTRERKILYTSLYHSFLMPIVMDDPDGGGGYRYSGPEKPVATVRTATHPIYSDLSLWDTFRTLHPLYNLILKDRHADILDSLVLMTQQRGGSLPRWPSGTGETSSMNGFPGIVVFSEAAQKGLLTGTLADDAYAISKTMVTPGTANGQECLAEYVDRGFCPDTQKGSVSYALDYAYAFEALSKWASFRGDDAYATDAHAKALLVKNHWSARRGFFVPRTADGALDEDISENDNSYLGLTRAAKAFVEGGAWNWAFSPFILARDLFELAPSSFHQRLETFFENGDDSIGSVWPAGSRYWHGNEHDYHAAWLFTLTGRPDLGQKWVDFILRTKYQARPTGLDGDDDGGAMSSWYVWSSMGLFPVAGTDLYALGAPVFERVLVKTDTSDILEILAPGASPYVKNANVDGTVLSDPWVKDAQIEGGVTLSFGRSAGPERRWGTP